MTITVEIIADSINERGDRITTFEMVYPRIIHAELLTHCMLAKNSASSRAIPVKTMLETIQSDMAMPVHWGKNQPGMQAKEEHFEKLGSGYTAEEWWKLAGLSAIKFAEEFADKGYHKQVANRLTEAYQHMKIVLTAVSGIGIDNFFHLRDHTDADPTIHLLAHTALAAYNDSVPRKLLPGEWHAPYYKNGFWSPSGYGKQTDLGFEPVDDKRGGYTLAEALKISASCCAQVSYRKSDDSLEKAEAVYDRLIGSQPVHASPTEHQATPIRYDQTALFDPSTWEPGITHVDRNGDLWSAKFKGWIQHRKLIANESCSDYEGVK